MRKVIEVQPQKNYFLRVVFDNNVTKFFDVKPYLDKGIFTELKNLEYFKRIKIVFGTVQWQNEQDFAPETL
ncbi:MAG: DUF2442 domain-containing protein, partial [Bacteroidota bacterium]